MKISLTFHLAQLHPIALQMIFSEAHKIGEDCAEDFIKNRIVKNSVEFFDPLPKNNLETFSILNKKTTVDVKGKEEILVADTKLFGRLVIIPQSLNMEEVLQYTFGPVPWSLASLDGSLPKTYLL